ncbi:helix-turn-helix domain-containing protein [Streptosporangium sp. NPDC004379]|uniref:helix-turn-helix domain-containing protein n=1 Tax=Streptosporangium sp. NPDC004379 TaxID=3366189 RepID=UPI0036BDD48F
MLSAVTLVARPQFSVASVTCRAHHTRWSEPDVHDDRRLVLVRRGRFRRSADGVAADLDPTVGYLGAPGQEERFAHPAGGDLCTSVTLAPSLWAELGDILPGGLRDGPGGGLGGRSGGGRSGGGRSGGGPGGGTTVYVDARVDLAHRRLLAAARGGDVDYALAEGLLRLVAAAGRAAAPPETRPAAAGQVVAAAREAILADHPEAGALLSLAALLEVSPYRLSRAFSREMGVSLTRYRNRVRVGRVMERLEGGECDGPAGYGAHDGCDGPGPHGGCGERRGHGSPGLAALAADLGFADQAHLTRTVREHLGHTPAVLRRLLTQAPAVRRGSAPAPAVRRGWSRAVTG